MYAKTAQKAGFSLRVSYKTRNFSLIHARDATKTSKI
jgi:hypothetical protein